MIKILIADNQELTREGIKMVLSGRADLQIAGQAVDINELEQHIKTIKPQVVIIDHNYRDHFNADDIKAVHLKFPKSRLLIISNIQNREEILDLHDHGIQNYVFKECSSDELVAAVYATAKGEQFFCGETLQTIAGDLQSRDEQPVLSLRETEVVQLVAAGLTNKEIAEKLYLSIHTIKTHRKNIIRKLGFTFKNAADLMGYTSRLPV